MATLLYETLGLPVRVYNKPTDTMKKAGAKEGSPKTDALAITYAMLDADETQKPVLECLRAIKVIETRRSLFYTPLPGFIHWKTGRVHSSHNQCGTNTRRASSSKPNLQQLSKHEKVEGFSPRVRELYIPHKKSAVIVSFDFKSQELLLMAEWSQDPTLIACFVGENLIDMHSKTGVGVHNGLHGTTLVYEEFIDILSNPDSPMYKAAKKSRALGKAVNFGSQYRIAAKKLSTMLLVVEDEAQAMLDAKADAFPLVESWSQREMEEVKVTGKTYTMLGAVRHLREAVQSEDRYEASKAPRQALSFRIQGSAAEMTKIAEGKIFKRGILTRYDAEYLAAVHDELVFSVLIDELPEFIPEVHALMTENYAGMSLPVGSSVSIGPDFGRQTELEGDFSKTNIQRICAGF
jgi:DNA polymerase-1